MADMKVQRKTAAFKKKTFELQDAGASVGVLIVCGMRDFASI